MKSVHIMGAGGVAGIGMTRCLTEHYQVTGEDGSPWAELVMECQKATLEDPADMVIGVPDSQIIFSSLVPPYSQVKLARDKSKTAQVLGELAPTLYWVRDTIGAGGKGASMSSQYLPGRNFSVEFVFFEGALLARFQKERLSYQVKEKTEGVDNRGSSAVSVCSNRPDVWHTAQQALDRLAGHTGTALHGFYGVDLKEDAAACPKVTEINAGRLLTASYSYFWLTGYNLPLIGVTAFLGEELPPLPDYPEGYGIVRQTDQLPKLFPPEITKAWL